MSLALSPFKFTFKVVALVTILGTLFTTNTSWSQTGFLFDPAFLKHDKIGHPASSLRLKKAYENLQQKGLLSRVKLVSGREATDDELLLVHTKEYLDFLKTKFQEPEGFLYEEKWSPYFNQFTEGAAKKSVGGLIDLTRQVLSGNLLNGFAFVNPSGHHAHASFGKGFCIFNNVAIATKWALEKNHIKKATIIDLDAHHGDGTQSIFKSDPRVQFISFHQENIFPFSGKVTEPLNIPLPVFSGDQTYSELLDKVVLPSIKIFQPDIIFVSLGFDGHWRDPMSTLGLTSSGYSQLIKKIYRTSRSVSKGRLIFVLEGGYNPEAVADGVENTIRTMIYDPKVTDQLGAPKYNAPNIDKLLTQTRRAAFH